MMGYGFGMGITGWILMGLFWIVAVGLAVWGATALLPGPRPTGHGRQETPEEILDRRFALGELDIGQYRRAREELKGSPEVRR